MTDLPLRRTRPGDYGRAGLYDEDNPEQRLDRVSASFAFADQVRARVCAVRSRVDAQKSRIFARNSVPTLGEIDLSPFDAFVPPGEYRMNRDDREKNRGKKFWRLEPTPKIPGWKCGILARCGFMFHLGSVSKGCITVDKFDPELTKQFDLIDEMLMGEDGHNTMTVEP